MIIKKGNLHEGKEIIFGSKNELLLTHSYPIVFIKDVSNITINGWKFCSSIIKNVKNINRNLNFGKEEIELYKNPIIGRIAQTYYALKFIWLEGWKKSNVKD